MALTPAKNLFGDDVSDQWKRKKQTPEERRAAKKAKLDPANWKTAKDVYDERSAAAAKKRKREAGEDVGEDQSSVKLEHSEPAVKKQKQVEKSSATTDAIGERPLEEVMNRNSKKRHKKRQSQKQKNAELREERAERKEKKKAERAAKREQENEQPSAQPKERKQEDKQVQKSKQVVKPKAASAKQTTPASKELKRSQLPLRQLENQEIDNDESAASEDESMPDAPLDTAEETEPVGPIVQQASDRSDFDKESREDSTEEEGWENASTASLSEGMPEILSPPHDSASSSVSSIQPPQASDTAAGKAKGNKQGKTEAKPTSPIQSEAERESARQRLQQQISLFRSERKADDRPIRSRADLLEQRRRKEQERKAAKKEQRKKEKEEEARKQDEEIAKRFSPGGSGSLLASPRSPMTDDGSNAFSFGRIAFEDGTAFDPSSGGAAAQKKHKGPADTASALKAAQAKQARIAGLDEQKKDDIAEKDMWLNARKRAHGERVKDDTSLLKKALKRQEKQKSKSGKEWDNRVEGVRSSQEAKQKKRTENLQKRKDEKQGNKSGSKKVKRPGFEGSFRGRTGKGKKK